MLLDDYFDFLAPDDIRIKGHRIGIETVLLAYLDGESPQEILERLPTLNLEKIYATITYYYHCREQVDAYLRAHREYDEQVDRLRETDPQPSVRSLIAIREKVVAEVLGVQL